MLVVLDCNVLVSAGLTDGTCRSVLYEVAGHHRCVLSEEIAKEYREVTARPKFASLEPIYYQLISLLETVSMYVDSTASSFSLPDSDDEMYLSAALEAVADVLVTGNKAHFPEEKYENTSIVTPRQFLDRVSRG